MEAVMTYSQLFFGWLLQTTLIASLIICLILLIQKTLGGRLGPRWCHALWLVLLVRMVLPWAPSSRLSLLNLIPSWDRQAQSQRLTAIAEQTELSPPAETAENHEAIPDQESQPEVTVRKVTTPKPQTLANVEDKFKSRLVLLRRILPILWLAGAIVIGAYLFVSNFSLWRIVKRDHPLVNQSILELFEECKAQMEVQSLVVVVPSESVKSPGLFGFVRPRLLLPKKMLDTATVEELRYVFLHELAHLKRHDIYLGWLTSLLQVLHWFNPFIWFAFYRMRIDRELACDALVLTRTGQDKSQEYGGAIVGLLRRFSSSRRLPAMAGIIESKSQLKRRITMITQFKNNSYQFSPVAVVLIIVLACISLPDPKNGIALGNLISGNRNHMTLRRVMDCDTDQPPRVSPDGKYFCEVRWKDKIKVLSVRELATGQQTILVSANDSCDISWKLVISPDSKLITYNWIDNERNTSELRVGSLNDSKYRVLYSGKSPIVPEDWSDDGAHILGSRKLKDKDGDEQSTEFVRISVKDGSIVAVTTIPKERSIFGYGRMVKLSPDGQYIAYHAREREAGVAKYNIFLFDVDKKHETILEHTGNNKLVGWIPDGKGILFTSAEAGTLGLWLQRITGGQFEGNPQLIRSDIGRFFPIDLTHNGACYYINSFRLNTLSTATLDLSSGKVLSSPQPVCQNADSSYGCAAWSPDGKYLTYCQKGSVGSSSIHIRSLGDGVEQVIDTDLPWTRWISWAPTGESIIVSFLSPGDGGWTATDFMWSVHKIDLETGARSILFKSDVGRPVRTQFSVDGKSLVYNAGNSLLVRDMSTGEERKIFEFGENGWNFWWDLSPDGRSVAVGAPGPDSWPTYLKVVSLEGKDLRELLPRNWGDIRDVLWAPDGKSILFTSQESLWQISAEGGEPRKLLASAGIGDSSRPTISLRPDGRHIALITSKYSEELWVMENFLPKDIDK